MVLWSTQSFIIKKKILVLIKNYKKMDADSKKMEVEVIEKGMELSDDDLFHVLGGAAACGCQCKGVNYAQLGPKTPPTNEDK